MMSQSLKTRAKKIIQLLKRAYPDAKCSLNHSNAFELLIATILSAQCTDQRVNIVTGDLFRKYRKPEDYLKVPASELQSDIRTTGFFRNKTKSIQGTAKVLTERHAGRVPETIEELLELPGVARKTANVVLGNAFGVTSGIVVDTHVTRLSRRPRPDSTKASRENRKRSGSDCGQEGLGDLFASAHRPWPEDLQGSESALRRMCHRRRVLSLVLSQNRRQARQLSSDRTSRTSKDGLHLLHTDDPLAHPRERRYNGPRSVILISMAVSPHRMPVIQFFWLSHTIMSSGRAPAQGSQNPEREAGAA